MLSGAPQNPDEVNPLTANLNFYIPIFGFGGTGERYFASGQQFGVTDLYTAPAGKWVYSVVSVVGSPAPSGKWTWVSTTDVKLKPVILDLDGDGLELISAEAGPEFDIFASGEPTPTGWFVGGDGALVFDANGNGVVDDVTELSFLHHSPGSTTDLQALVAFDGNANGWLDAGDSNYGLFRIWRDSNVNGVSDAGELVTLAAADVQSISLSGGGGQYDVQGNTVYAASTFTRVSGGAGTAFDVGLQAFSRGSKQIGSDASWALMEVETGERIAVAQPAAAAVNIANLGTHTVLGGAVQGYQLTTGNDAVTLAAGWGSKRLYVDGNDGNDTINLGASTVDNVLKGGIGEDYITSGRGNDWISPGATGGYGDSVVDFGGDDHYVVERDAFAFIDDRGGRDVLLMTGLSSSELQFFRFSSAEFLDSIYVTGGNTGVHLMGMGNSNPSQGIEFLVTKDRTFLRSEIEALAGPLSFSAEENTADVMGMTTLPRVLEDWIALP